MKDCLVFDLLDGLPVHPLVLHAVVVLAPLTAILALLYALMPRVRAGLRWPLVVLAVLTMFLSWVTRVSGEVLEHRLKVQGEDAAALRVVHEHAEAGDLAFVACLLLGLTTLAAVLWLLKPLLPRAAGVDTRDGVTDSDERTSGATAPTAPRAALGAKGTAATVALLLASLFTGYAVLNAGHTGAKAVWGDQVDTSIHVSEE